MDLNACIRILKVEHKDDSMTEYFNGVAFFKNVAHKKMKTHLINPSILLLSGGTESSTPDLVLMETVLVEEPDYTKSLLRKLTKLKLSLLITEGPLTQWVISELTRFGVTVLINVKKSVMQMVARVAQGKVVTDIDEAVTAKNVIGRCREVEVRSYNRTGIVLLRTADDLARGGSILLSGTDVNILRKMKGIIRDLIIYARNLRLEGSLFAQIGVTHSSPLVGDIAAQEISFQYMNTSGKLCIKPIETRVRLYQEGDLPLGQWVADRINSLGESCAMCGSSQLSHKDHFLRRDAIVTVRYQHRGKEAYYRDTIEVICECSVCGSKSCPLPLNLWSWELSFHRFLANFFTPRSEQHGKCTHALYPHAKVRFTYGLHIAEFSYSAKRRFDLLPLAHITALDRYYTDLTAKAFADTVSAATELYQLLVEELTEIKDKLKRSGMDQKDAAEVQGSIGETFLGIVTAMREIENTKEITDVLHIHFFRKRLFLEICATKVTLQAYKRVPRSGNRDTSQTLEVVNHSVPDPHECRPREFHEQLRLHKRRSTNLLLRNKVTLDHDSSILFPSDWQPIEPSDPIVNSQAFRYMLSGCQTLPPSFQNTFIPVRQTDPLSVIAYALSSQKYHEEVYRFFQMNVDMTECIESELLSGAENSFDITFHTFDFSEVSGKSDLMRLYGPSVSFHVKVFYARQFQALRLFGSNDASDFLRSIFTSLPADDHLGKSGARFHISHDSKYMAKEVDERECQMFADMAPNYFRHVCKSFYHNMPSRLVHIVGVFRFSVRDICTGEKALSWLLVMRNLAFGVSPSAVVYDLKGTANSRRFVKDGEKQTKMDLNFISDMRGLPISMRAESSQLLESALWNDTLFLSKQNVIDYSLVVMISEEEGVIAAGIVDYLRQYTFDKAIESKYKKVIANEIPTITNPTQYKERFRQQVLQDYFLAVPD